jgi:hypothetical protein
MNATPASSSSAPSGKAGPLAGLKVLELGS